MSIPRIAISTPRTLLTYGNDRYKYQRPGLLYQDFLSPVVAVVVFPVPPTNCSVIVASRPLAITYLTSGEP